MGPFSYANKSLFSGDFVSTTKSILAASGMPSKIQLDENLWFLYICLQKSDYKAVGPWNSICLSMADPYGKIDFNAVGDATKLKPPAARMRYTRLRRAIEGGTLIGTHGMPFPSGPEKVVEVRKKRRRLLQSAYTEEVDDPEPLVTHRESPIVRMEKVEDGLADQYDSGLSANEKKIPSTRGNPRALKRKVDADEEKSDLESALLRLEEHVRDSDPNAQSPSPESDHKGDMDLKNSVAAKGKRHIRNGIKEQTGSRKHELAPPDFQQPIKGAFKSWPAKGLTLEHETQKTVSTDITTTQTRLIPEVKDEAQDN